MRQRFTKKSCLYKADEYPTPIEVPKRFILNSEYDDNVVYVISLTQTIKAPQFKTYMYTSEVDKFVPIDDKPPEPPNPWYWTTKFAPPYSVANMIGRTINHNAIMRENWEEISEEEYAKLFLTMNTEDIDD